MSAKTYPKKAVAFYAVALLVTIAAAALFLTEHFWAGVVVAGAAFGLAYGAALANGHLTARTPKNK